MSETSDQVDLSPDSIIQLAQDIQQASKLRALELQKEKLQLRAELEGLEVAEELKKVTKDLEALKEKQTENTNNWLLELIQKKSVFDTRLQKLAEKRGQIQDSVFNALEAEYKEEKQVIDQQLIDIKAKLRQMVADASKGKKSLTYAIEELEVRKEIEGIPDEEFQKRGDELKKELAQSEALQEASKVILEQVES
ncbi:MAG: hypothetical protein ACFFE8_12395 [Candidatus Heimdallarchaeota archaeon]